MALEEDVSRRDVEIRIIPLYWAMKEGKEKGLNTKDLFELFDSKQDEFLDTDLLDAMFTHIWK